MASRKPLKPGFWYAAKKTPTNLMYVVNVSQASGRGGAYYQYIYMMDKDREVEEYTSDINGQNKTKYSVPLMPNSYALDGADFDLVSDPLGYAAHNAPALLPAIDLMLTFDLAGIAANPNAHYESYRAITCLMRTQGKKVVAVSDCRTLIIEIDPHADADAIEAILRDGLQCGAWSPLVGTPNTYHFAYTVGKDAESLAFAQTLPNVVSVRYGMSDDLYKAADIDNVLLAVGDTIIVSHRWSCRVHDKEVLLRGKITKISKDPKHRTNYTTRIYVDVPRQYSRVVGDVETITIDNPRSQALKV